MTVGAKHDLSTYDAIRRAADGIRLRVLEHTIEHGGYLSQACSSAEMMATLYLHCMKLGPSRGPMIPVPFGMDNVPSAQNPHRMSGAIYNGAKAPETDRFFLSPTHYALTLYATLIEAGRLAPEGLAQFSQDGSSVEMIGGEHSPGHEVNGGSFGQALSQAAGVAVARRLKGESGHVWAFMSDGEFQEGQTWEAFTTMAFHKVDNLSIFVDVNNQQVDGRMQDVMSIEPLQSKLSAFGAHVVTVNGHDIEALVDAAQERQTGKPLVVLGYTNPYQGIEILKERYPHLHYIRFKNEAERQRYRDVLQVLTARRSAYGDA
jgi:transketolase